MSKITLSVGDSDLNFNVETDDFNDYLNDLTPTDKIAPAYNFLVKTVIDDDKDAFKKCVLKSNKPNGIVVLQMVGVIAEQFGGEVKISLKK